MGKKTRSISFAGALFSQVRLRVLRLFFGQPDKMYQISDVIRLVESGRGAVQRELEKLTAAGILSVSIAGTRKNYCANRQSPIFNDLYRLILKTVGMVEPIRNALEPFRDDIDLAFVYGSVAKGTDTAKSDIDLMIFAHDTGYSEIYGALQKAEKILMRPINPTVTSIKEWQHKFSEKGSFARRISQQPKLFIFGTEHELKRIKQSR
jgi:predicted nucleotidyltransferase